MSSSLSASLLSVIFHCSYHPTPTPSPSTHKKGVEQPNHCSLILFFVFQTVTTTTTVSLEILSLIQWPHCTDGITFNNHLKHSTVTTPPTVCHLFTSLEIQWYLLSQN